MTRTRSTIASPPSRSAARAQIGIVRGGKEAKLAIALETAPETPRDEIVIRARSPFMGVKVANISPALADELRLDASAEGVVVLDVADGSLAQSLGFQRGDVIAAVNNEKIARTRDLDRVAKDATRAVEHHHRARRADDLGDVRRMSTRPKRGAKPVRSRRARCTTRRVRWPTSCARRSSPKWSGRIICSGRTARSPACWRRARSARWSSGGRPAPARPRWRGCWPTRPRCISSSSPPCSPASRT